MEAGVAVVVIPPVEEELEEAWRERVRPREERFSTTVEVEETDEFVEFVEEGSEVMLGFVLLVKDDEADKLYKESGVRDRWPANINELILRW